MGGGGATVYDCIFSLIKNQHFNRQLQLLEIFFNNKNSNIFSAIIFERFFLKDFITKLVKPTFSLLPTSVPPIWPALVHPTPQLSLTRPNKQGWPLASLIGRPTCHLTEPKCHVI